jgi:hypothetical protein
MSTKSFENLTNDNPKPISFRLALLDYVIFESGFDNHIRDIEFKEQLPEKSIWFMPENSSVYILPTISTDLGVNENLVDKRIREFEKQEFLETQRMPELVNLRFLRPALEYYFDHNINTYQEK